jgi:outer membrane protein
MKKILLIAVTAILTMTSAIAQQKIGHVNSDSLLNKMPSRNIAIEQLKKFEADGYKELQDMNDELEKSVAVYEKNKPTMTPMIQQIEERKLQEKDQRIRDRQTSLQQELQAISQELNNPILERIQKAVEIVADRKKLSYVIDLSTTLYHKGGIDLTPEVMVELLKLDADAVKAAQPK